MNANARKFIARQKMRLFNGLTFIGIFTSIVNYLTFAKVWSATFEYYGIPPVTLYIGLPLTVVLGGWYLGYLWFKLRLWEEESSHMNVEINPEFSRQCEEVREIKKMLEDMQRDTRNA